ncbi:MAG: hypothetical protein Q9160_002422 [Pyrenula sp. 1 TL-2023]
MATPASMKQKQWLTSQTGIQHLKLEEEVPAPTAEELGDGEVLVRVGSVGLNYRDLEVCAGTYGHHASLSQDQAPIVPCSDMCGRVLHSRSPLWRPGARVLSIFNQSHLTGQCTEAELSTGLGLPLPGVLIQYRVFPGSGLVAVPAHLSDEEACTLPIAAVTAWMALNSFSPVGRPVRGREKVVLLQGTGGVSIAGLQIAKALGLRVIVTSSEDEKLRRAREELGADFGINYRKTPEWGKRVLEFTGGRGADVIFETGGTYTLEKSFECVAFGGVISAIGYLSGKEEQQGEGNRLNANVLALKRNVTLKGILNGPRDRFEEMLETVYTEEKGVRPVVDRVFEFERAREALEYLASGKHFGKVVVKVS